MPARLLSFNPILRRIIELPFYESTRRNNVRLAANCKRQVAVFVFLASGSGGPSTVVHQKGVTLRVRSTSSLPPSPSWRVCRAPEYELAPYLA